LDPVTQTTSDWSVPGKKVLVKSDQPRPPASTARHFPAPTVSCSTSDQPHVEQAGITTEDLGTETIQGVEAYGIRETSIIPAGTIGNDEPLTRTGETWRATAHGLFGLTVREINIDPRHGKSDMELTSFTQAEPDPSLFQLPEGYKIVNVSASQLACASAPVIDPPPPPSAR